MLKIHADTFTATTAPSQWAEEYGWNEGSVEVTFEGKTKRVRCLAPDDKRSEWTIYGLCARYATGTKVWSASVRHDGNRILSLWTGFESRSGRHSQPRLVGFIDNVNAAHISKR